MLLMKVVIIEVLHYIMATFIAKVYFYVKRFDFNLHFILEFVTLIFSSLLPSYNSLYVV